MCECSATHSESKPRSSNAAASSVGEIEYSVKKIDAPISIVVRPAILSFPQEAKASARVPPAITEGADSTSSRVTPADITPIAGYNLTLCRLLMTMQSAANLQQNLL